MTMNPQRRPPLPALRLAARLGLALSLALAGAVALPPGARPVHAGIESLVVDRADDVPGLACTVAINDCSLRSAVAKANTDSNESQITFSSNFTITLGSPLVLTATGTTVLAASNQVVEINANNNGQVFRVSAADTKLEGLRMYGSSLTTAIVWISDSAQRVRIANNVIGDDDPGFLGACGNSPNSQSGIYISSNADPGTGDAVAWIYGNSIKCIPGYGIQIAGSREVVIGADSTGLAGSAQINFIEVVGSDAVHLSPGSNFNVIRNSALQYSGGSGLVIDGGDNNSVYGNYMQVNDEHGILLTGGASLNSIGCPLFAGDPNSASLRNVIQQNTGDGIRITGAGTDSNLILCNWIGVQDDGLSAAANAGNGVQIMAGAEGNIIGAGATTRNVISGNGLSGVLITGTSTRLSVVAGNYIGTNATATGVVGNEQDGVRLTGGATSNTIGGSSIGALNIIGGNDDYGVYISGSSTATNTVSFNDIGLSSQPDLPLPNGAGGIRLQNDTHGNIVGGSGKDNYVAYNTGPGVSLSSGVKATQLLSNLIFANSGAGIELVGTGTTNNLLANVSVYRNGGDGITEHTNATLNVWQTINVYGNGGLGVDKFDSDSATNTPTAPYPVITSVNVGTGQIQGVANNNALVEVYRAAPDPSGFGEGKTYLGSAVANGSGFWSFFVAGGQANCYTAFQTVAGVSSEFGAHTCPTVFLPEISK